jgi:hypothetical protein
MPVEALTGRTVAFATLSSFTDGFKHECCDPSLMVYVRS